MRAGDRPAVVLVVDDDGEIRRALALAVAQAGGRVLEAANGREGLTAFRAGRPDLVVTDLVMPGGDGFELIRAIRQESPVPILVLSVHGREDDKVRALDLGADDYVTKPFSVGELLARVRAELRRSITPAVPAPTLLRFPDLEVDSGRHLVRQGERDVKLTPMEFGILEVLARNYGRPISVAGLISAVWNDAPGTTTETVRVHVCTLRRKLEPDPARPRYIVTEPWIGYRFLLEPLPSS